MTALMLEKQTKATKETLSYETPKALELASFIGELREISADERIGMLEVMNTGMGSCSYGCSSVESRCSNGCK